MAPQDVFGALGVILSVFGSLYFLGGFWGYFWGFVVISEGYVTTLADSGCFKGHLRVFWSHLGEGVEGFWVLFGPTLGVRSLYFDL